SKESVKKFVDLGIPYIIDERITEISWGANEGQPMGEDTKLRFKKMISEWSKGNLDYSIPGGETGLSLVTRIDSFINDLKQRPEQYILVNTHGRALKMMITRLLQEDISMMEKYKHHNTGLYLFEQRDDKFTLLKENNIEHLI
ncbi:MAG TPA: histidine phosphatase family protein, partial [Bacteroidetes bacterium]|nr:histidine phosphatase family protein [Bacteroidota bacterium]